MTFQEKIYQLVRTIPPGKVMTYKEVAEKIGHRGAYRAVGMILSRNYNPEVPCHRVIRSDGKMAGYNRGGAQTKLKMLKSEGVKFEKL